MIHETAVVDDPSAIGKGTRIWHFSHVMAGANIGVECTLGQNVFVADQVTIGDRVKVQNNVSIYQGVTLADDVFVGPSVVFTNVSVPRAHISKKHLFEATPIGRGATIGANATIVCGHRIGAHAFVGAGAVVTRDVPDYALIVGNPAKQVGWVCRCGVKLVRSELAGKDVMPSSESDYDVMICPECRAPYQVGNGCCRMNGD